MNLAMQAVVRLDGPETASESIGDEVVVYHARSGAAHLLSPSVASVWRHADGRTVQELFRLFDGSTAEAMTWQAIDELQEAGLLASPIIMPAAGPAGMTRRQLLRKMGIAAVAVPVVTTILTQSGAAAQTCGERCAPCGSGAPPCCTGRTCKTMTATGSCGNGNFCCALAGELCQHNQTCCSGSCSGISATSTCN